MCWSAEASTIIATIGFASAAFAAYKKQPAPLYISLAYFSLMEALQAFTYTVINDCANPANQVATLLGYLHIVYQPFFINYISLAFIPKPVAMRIQFPVYGICFLMTIFMLVQVYPFDWAPPCISGDALCGKSLCSVSGNWHIAWNIPWKDVGFSSIGVMDLSAIGLGFLHKYTYSFPDYCFPAFVLPMLYGSWRFTIYHLLMGPLLAVSLTSNANEWPAIWCLFSISVVLLILIPNFRKYLYVKNWFFFQRFSPELPTLPTTN